MQKTTAIAHVSAQEILDSRGNPTLACTVRLQGGAVGWAAVPSGASTGAHEAVELRDDDPARYGGKGVLQAVANVEGPLAKAVVGRDAADTARVDGALLAADGTPGKRRLGANAILAVSLATARAAAAAQGVPLYRFLGGAQARTLPVPMMNILNGGVHAANNLDIQEFMVVPRGGATFAERLRMGAEVYHALRAVLKARGLGVGVGDEGGFAPDLEGNGQALDLLVEAIGKAGFRPGEEVALALDLAASEWVKGEGYLLPKAGTRFDRAGLIGHLGDICARYPICSLEDPLGEDDWAGFAELTARLGQGRLVVGDDLFVTNPERLREGIARRAANAILIKVNQIGTLTETLEAIALARRAGYATIISHRSGDTEDAFIADLAVAVNAPYIKSGAPCRAERVAKYNRLLAIAHDLGC